MSINGSNMGGPSTSCLSHGYEQFPDQIGLIDSVIARSSSRAQLQSPRALSTSPIIQTGPASPDRALSPRAGMLRHMATQQAFRSMHTAPVPFGSAPKCSFNTAHLRRDSVHSHCSPPPTLCSQSVRALSPGLVPKQAARPIVPCIQIANGTEVETGSPISPTGTMLSYTSNRAVDSGLLAIPALSEPQVAEYRFWVPCGRRVCAFGCGGAHEGKTPLRRDCSERKIALSSRVLSGTRDTDTEMKRTVLRRRTLQQFVARNSMIGKRPLWRRAGGLKSGRGS